MTRTTQLLKLYVLFLSVSVTLHCCCSEPTRVTIVGTGEMLFLNSDLDSNNFGRIEAMTDGPFSISCNYELEFVEQFVMPELINSAYGFSCDEEFQNRLVESSLSLSCDKDIEQNEVTISAGNELKNLAGLSINIVTGTVIVIFTEETRANTSFTKEAHQFTLSINTNDGLNLVSQAVLTFE